MGVPERQLLRAVRRVIGRIEIDRDLLDPPVQPAPVALDHRVGQHRPHAIQLAGSDRILEPAERRLRRQGGAVDRIAAHEQFVDGVVGQARGIIGIGIATRDAVQALRQQVDERVLHLARLAGVLQARGQRLD
jgi:hypothetical protein